MLHENILFTWKILHGMDIRVERLTQPPSLFQICPKNLNFPVDVAAVVDGAVVDDVVVVVSATPS